MRLKGKLMSMCIRMTKQVFLVSYLGLTHMLFDDHVFLIMSIAKTDNSGSRLLRRTMELNRPSFIGYTIIIYSLLIVLSMCNHMERILRPWEYQEMAFHKTCTGYHQKSTVKGGNKYGSHICWKECRTTSWLKSGNYSSGIRREILRGHLGIMMSPNHLSIQFIMWITRTSQYSTRNMMNSDWG
jgi:hypothetical protein